MSSPRNNNGAPKAAASFALEQLQLVPSQRTHDADDLSDIDDVSIDLNEAQINQIAGLSVKDEWCLLEKRILKAERMRIELIHTDKDTDEWLRDFVERRGEEGQKLAGDFPERYQDLRETQEEAEKYFCDLQTRRQQHEEALVERNRAEAELRAYQAETWQKSQEIVRRLHEATQKLKRCTVGGPKQKNEQVPEKKKTCPVCGILYVARGRDCPAVAFHKIVNNLCRYLCSDADNTPVVVTCSDGNSDHFNGIITLSHNLKCQAKETAEKLTDDTSVECDNLAVSTPKNSAEIRTRGAIYALRAIADEVGAELPTKLADFWKLILPENLTHFGIDNNDLLIEKNNQLIYNLQILEVMLPSLENSLYEHILKYIQNICLLLSNPYKAVRNLASRCIAASASRNSKKTIPAVLNKIIEFLDPKNDANRLCKTQESKTYCRQGAVEVIACIVDECKLEIVPYIVHFLIPLLGCMSDNNESVRLLSSVTFASLIQMIPLATNIFSTNEINEKNEEWQFLNQLFNPQKIPQTVLDVPVSVKLRSYQQEGLNWLDFLNRCKLHGILCDDMGLGKTLQTLCILAVDHHRTPNVPPSIIICPPTLIGHWIGEVEKFFHESNLSAIAYMGNPQEREKLRCQLAKFKLVVSSYDIIRKDIFLLEKCQWNYCILDEGHIIKNSKTKISQAVKKLCSNHRLILSGTPIQNNVLELWSLFDFLMPGFLGCEKQFIKKYSKPILACKESKAGKKEKKSAVEALESLHRQVLPFLLRRTKEDVLTDLPPKITQDYFCDLSPLQKTLYEDFQVKNTILVNKIDINAAKSSGHIFKALRYLKNVCNHPKLVLTSEHPEYSKIQNQLKNVNSDLSDIEHAAKLPALKQLLLDCGIGQSQQTKDYQNYYNLTDETLSESNFLFDIVKKNHLVGQHRALIFCQLKNMLDIIEKDLFQKHLPTVTYMRIDGNVSIAERQSIVSRFNADPSIDILLLTTHVGGLGLNLTGADTVIFFEHDWNPMKDLQAMDRAHRIGQKKVVNVYRLITKQTIEEKIMNLQKFKLHTAKSVVNIENKSLKSMHKEEILDLFKLDNSRKKKQNTCSEDNIDNKNVNLGTSKSVSEFLSTISEGYEYEEEYDINSYIVNFKSFLGKDDE
ncbi:hypothetical protein TKK_0007780 [Trichogramma kaykai]